MSFFTVVGAVMQIHMPRSQQHIIGFGGRGECEYCIFMVMCQNCFFMETCKNVQVVGSSIQCLEKMSDVCLVLEDGE